MDLYYKHAFKHALFVGINIVWTIDSHSGGHFNPVATILEFNTWSNMTQKYICNLISTTQKSV